MGGSGEALGRAQEQWNGRSKKQVFNYARDNVYDKTMGNGKLVLLDGDKIAVLLSSFLQEQIIALSTAIPS